MRQMVIADLHLSDNERDRYRHEFVSKTLPKLLIKYEIDELLILGDLCEEKDRHSARLVNEVVSIMIALGKVCPVIVLMGNHDYLDRNHPFFQFLKRIRTITWIDRPTERNGDLFLPHTDDWVRDWKEIGIPKGVRVFTHNTFDGADLGHGQAGHGIPLSALEHNRVISGDVHVPQKLGNVTYVGAPYSVDFGDDYQPRVLIIDEDKITSLKVGGVQKRLIEDAWPFKNKHNDLNAGDILKVRIQLKPEQVAKWHEIRDAVRSWGQKHDYLIYAVHPVATASHGGTSTRPVHTRKTDEQLVAAYAKHRNLDEHTLKTGLWLMKRANAND